MQCSYYLDVTNASGTYWYHTMSSSDCIYIFYSFSAIFSIADKMLCCILLMLETICLKTLNLFLLSMLFYLILVCYFLHVVFQSRSTDNLFIDCLASSMLHYYYLVKSKLGFWLCVFFIGNLFCFASDIWL